MYRSRPRRALRSRPRRTLRTRRVSRKRLTLSRRRPYVAPTNSASVKETYSTTVMDGAMTFFRQTQLGDAVFDRSQQVASAFQQYRIKYIKLTFRPSADTFTPVVGNSIPQLYFMYDKNNAIPTNATSDTLYSMGAKPHRMDDKNLVFAWKPSVLNTSLGQAGATTSADVLTRPWLSTNANAQNPGAAWAPSTIAHLGCVWYVTKINAQDALEYTVDVEVVFQFRKPTWKGSSKASTYQTIENGQVVTKPNPAYPDPPTGA